jgi:hypothetical protein
MVGFIRRKQNRNSTNKARIIKISVLVYLYTLQITHEFVFNVDIYIYIYIQLLTNCKQSYWLSSFKDKEVKPFEISQQTM